MIRIANLNRLHLGQKQNNADSVSYIKAYQMSTSNC